jgi:AraC-like DNA-binding protein
MELRSSEEEARFLRPSALAGVEALHATFVHHRYAPHVHDALTIAHVVKGAAGFELDGSRHLAPAGNVFLIPPRAVHTGESASPGGYSYRVLYLELEHLAERHGSELRRDTRRMPIVVRHPQLAQALRFIHGMLRLPAAALEQGEALAIVSCLVYELTSSSQERSEPGRVGHPAVKRARAYIDDRWREDFTLDQLALASGLSPFHLSRRFRAQIGMPPSAYRRALRVQAAQRLLRNGTPPARAAAECGFYDQAHLNRHFRRVTGVTPSQYASAGDQ